MQRSTKKIKPEVDYRQFRFKKMNTPEFSHVKLLLFWPFFGLIGVFAVELYKLLIYSRD